MNRIIIAVLASFCFISCFAQNPVLETHWSQPNGYVNAVEKDTINNIVYLGGYFNHVGSGKPFNSVIDADGGTDMRFDNANWYVNISMSDGEGGWYIGGDFNKVGDSTRNGIAHLNAAGKVTSKFSGISALQVYAIYPLGDTLFVGGNFTKVNGQPRENIAAFNKNTGALLDWTANTNGTVKKIVSDGKKIYISGSFTTVAGSARAKLASVDIATGTVTSWNPNPNNEITDLCMHEDVLYVSGGFTNIATETRGRIAAFNTTTGNLTSWKPYADNAVFSMAIKDNVLYIAGMFIFIDFNSRQYLAGIDIHTAEVIAWNPVVNNSIMCIGINENALIASGEFTSINNQPVKYLASVDLTSGNLNEWDFNPTTASPDYPQTAGSSVRSIVCVNNKISLTGIFTSLYGVYRNNIVALDATTGKPTGWSPDMSNEVIDISVSGDLVYPTGSFTYVNGLQRNFIAAIDRVTGNPTNWTCNDFNTFGAPQCIKATKDIIYVGGDFTRAGGADRNNLVALDAVTGNAISWNPNVNSMVLDLILKHNILYIGGNFSKVGGEDRKCLAAVDIETGDVTAWNPTVSVSSSAAQIQGISIYNNTLYVTGYFNSIGGQPRNNIAAVDMLSGAVADWAPVYYDISYVSVKGSKAYVASVFSIRENKLPQPLASLDSRTAEITEWKPKQVSSASSLKIIQNKLYITGRGTYPKEATNNFYVYALPCYEPTITAVGATSTSICEDNTNAVELKIETGNLNDASDWKWYEDDCNTASIASGTSVSILPQETTTYFVRAEGGCTKPMDCKEITILVNSPEECITTGVTAETQSEYMIYPNPNAGSFYITAKHEKVLSVVNIFGQQQMQIILNQANNFNVHIDGLSNGVYFVYNANEKVACQKIIVNK